MGWAIVVGGPSAWGLDGAKAKCDLAKTENMLIMFTCAPCLSECYTVLKKNRKMS